MELSEDSATSPPQQPETSVDWLKAREKIPEVRFGKRTASMAVGAAIGAGVGIAIGPTSESRATGQGHWISATLGCLGGALGAGIGRAAPFLKGKTIYVAPVTPPQSRTPAAQGS